MVATPHVLASESGLAALRAGGNALDAAIAAAATIAVVYPHMNGVGGDNVWLIHDAGAGRLTALCGIGRSARAASSEWYAARGMAEAIPIRGGPAALTVPGAVDGWWQAHQYSTRNMGSALPWKALFGDAIAYARDGFSASAGQRVAPPAEPDLFGPTAIAPIKEHLWPLYHPDALAQGPLVQRDLALTLEAVRDGGPDAFYSGDIARRIVAAVSAAGSPLSREDFAEHKSEWVEPLRVAYRKGQACSLPPPTQGIPALAILALADRFDMAGLDETDYIHVLVEATKLAFEDRDRYLTDPDWMEKSAKELLDPDHLDAMARRIDMRRTGRPAAGMAAGGDTVAIITADAQGNAVSLIQSVYFTWGSGLVAGDTGVVLQNRGSFFSLDARQANALAPRKRTLHTLIPSMYLEGGRARFVYGTMGGEGQPQTQAALVTRRLDRGMGAQACVEAPRWVYGRTWGAPTRALRLEGRYGPDVAGELASRGHDVKMAGEWDDLFGHAQCIWLDPQGGLLGGSDPRADGGALGF